MVAKADRKKNEVRVTCGKHPRGLYVLVDAKVLDPRKEIVAYLNDEEVFRGLAKPSLATIVATVARHVSFSRGAEHLACLSLGPRGILRWYAGCCRTPLANTPRDWRLPYAGLVHSALAKPLEASFPPVQMHVNTKSAKGRPPSMLWSEAVALLGFVPRLIAARFTGSYRATPFFGEGGEPRAPVQVLTPAERARATSAALAFTARPG